MLPTLVTSPETPPIRAATPTAFISAQLQERLRRERRQLERLRAGDVVEVGYCMPGSRVARSSSPVDLS